PSGGVKGTGRPGTARDRQPPCRRRKAVRPRPGRGICIQDRPSPSSPRGGNAMDARIDYTKASPAALKAMYALQAAVNASGLEPPVQELIKLRVSQINGCAFCIDMHFREATAKGEKPERLYLLDAWRESPVYTDRERAALAWAEAVTLVSQTHVPDDVFRE